MSPVSAPSRARSGASAPAPVPAPNGGAQLGQPGPWELSAQRNCTEKHFFWSALLLRLFLYYEHIKHTIKSIQVDIIELNFMTHTTESKLFLNSVAQHTTNKSCNL